MRFAEKMLLNAKYFGLVAGIRHDSSGNRCALGLVEECVGSVRKHAEVLYPWLMQVEATCPCPCRYPAMAINGLIAHVFNEHVMGDKTWTMEKLADWAESYDPTKEVDHSAPVTIREEVSGQGAVSSQAVRSARLRS